MTQYNIAIDTYACDAEILIYEVQNRYEVGKECSILVGLIPFYNGNYVGYEADLDFHKDVLNAYSAICKSFDHDTDRSIKVEVRFHNNYCGGV